MNQLRVGLTAVLLLACTSIAGAVAPHAMAAAVQTDAAKAALPERMKKVRDDFFKGATTLPNLVRELKEILAIDPGQAEAHMLLGIAYHGMASPDLAGEAVAELRQAIALAPDLAVARMYLGLVYRDLGRLERAREEFETALKQEPGNPQFLAVLGETERRLKNLDRAEQLLRQALQGGQPFPQARYYLGLTLFDRGQRDAGMSELESLLKAGSKAPDLYLNLGVMCLETKRVDRAIEILNDGLRMHGERSDMRIPLARAYRIKGQLDMAAHHLNLAAEQTKNAQDSPFSSERQAAFDLYVELGSLKQSQGELTRAAGYFQKALDIDPNHAETKQRLAEVKRRLAQKPPKQKGGDEQ
jgi:tetratricopeptide (TPR) repeat protein